MILKARKHFGPRDSFEAKLFLSLRGSVVSLTPFNRLPIHTATSSLTRLMQLQLFEGLFNDRINLTPEEWTQLVTNDLDVNTPDGEMLRSLPLAPTLLQRARTVHQKHTDPTQIRDEIWSIYQNCKETRRHIKARSVESDIFAVPTNKMSPSERALVARLIYSHNQRTYGHGLSITLFYNCVLNALGGTDPITTFDSQYLSEEGIALAERSNIYRPIEIGYLSICLTAAWAAATDQGLRDRIIRLVEYSDDFKLRGSRYMRRELEWTAEHLRLGRPFR